LLVVTGGWAEGVRSLLDDPSPAVLTTYRKDGSANVSSRPSWPNAAGPAAADASVGFVAMAAREAACHCGQLRLEVAGDPFVVSMCHCLACQRRTGSAFGMQAAFTPDQVHVVGRFSDYLRVSDEADRKEHIFHFCPECGSQVFYTEPTEPDLIVVSVGAFADPSFPPPTESGYDSRRHSWLAVPATIERHDGQ